jgi:uncharacterized protein (TIGR02001 family)
MNNNTKLIIASSILACSFNLKAEVSFNVGLVSDYVLEGVSQTMGDPALQGGVDFSNESGFYAGAWGSNVDFGGDAKGAEIDLYFGYAGDLNKNIEFDVGYILYKYVGDDNGAFDEADFGEFQASLTFMENTNIAVWLADDDAVGGSSTRFKAKHSFELASDYNLNLAFHYWSTDDDTFWWGEDNYTAYLIGVSKTFNEFDLALNFTDTSMDGFDQADGRISLLVSRSF